MPKIYKRNCDFCGEYYEGIGKGCCSRRCGSILRRGKPMPRKISLWERFWAKVNMTDPLNCWEWQGMKKAGWGGYGLFWFDGTSQNRAHRMAWTLIYGEIPDGLFVLHKCDNPGCVNPLHLWLGTQTDNCADMRTKGRGSWAVGENNGKSKLNPEKVRQIRKLYTDGVNYNRLGIKFNINSGVIWAIINGRTWKHVE